MVCNTLLVTTKTIRQLALVVYEQIVNSGFALVNYQLIDNSSSLLNSTVYSVVTIYLKTKVKLN